MAQVVKVEVVIFSSWERVREQQVHLSAAHLLI